MPESDRHFARQAAKEVLGSVPRPDVVLCMSDVIALELLQQATDLGIKVPEELRITGFDGIDEADRSRPRLTTVCQASDTKGAEAAKALLNGVEDKRILPFELNIRETV